MANKKYSEKIREKAEKMYVGGMGVTEISKILEIPWSTIYSWPEIEKWRQSPIKIAKKRLVFLIGKNKKTRLEINEIDGLMTIYTNALMAIK